MKLPSFVFLIFFGFFSATCFSQEKIIVGAERIENYLPLIKNKRVALVVNQTSRIGDVLLPDTLLKRGVTIAKIFSPEHGFRGDADAGAQVKNGIDPKTKLQVISLYGKNKKPSSEQLKDVDVVIYDLQDVGVRFYTYISTLQYVMEACAENGKELIVLDRPNPLGFIVDGPVLDKRFKSFVGMQPIPVIYGMTAGEYAQMLLGEKWIENTNLKMTVIPCENYTHISHYTLPVSPSPNLKNNTAIYLYPSLCFFEGTVISVGRGTDFPFQMYGHPDLKGFDFSFTPVSKPGATSPPLKGLLCHGEMIATNSEAALLKVQDQLNLTWLLRAYEHFPNKEKFFNSFFKNLAGTDLLQKQIAMGQSEKEIRKSWQADLDKFKLIRKKYLLYEE